jgi:hypothetical protein
MFKASAEARLAVHAHKGCQRATVRDREHQPNQQQQTDITRQPPSLPLYPFCLVLDFPRPFPLLFLFCLLVRFSLSLRVAWLPTLNFLYLRLSLTRFPLFFLLVTLFVRYVDDRPPFFWSTALRVTTWSLPPLVVTCIYKPGPPSACFFPSPQANDQPFLCFPSPSSLLA